MQVDSTLESQERGDGEEEDVKEEEKLLLLMKRNEDEDEGRLCEKGREGIWSDL